MVSSSLSRNDTDQKVDSSEHPSELIFSCQIYERKGNGKGISSTVYPGSAGKPLSTELNIEGFLSSRQT